MSPSNLAAVVNLVFALLVIGGGVYGFRSGGSSVSLYSGLISGALLIVGSIGLIATDSTWGITLSYFVAGLLAVFFLYRFAVTKSIMPGVAMGALSVVVLLINLWVLYSITDNGDSSAAQRPEAAATASSEAPGTAAEKPLRKENRKDSEQG